MTSCQTRVALPCMPLTAHRAMTKKKGFATMADARIREGWHFEQIRASSELEAGPSRDEDSKPLKSQHNQLQVPFKKEVAILSSISALGAATEETASTVQKQHPLSRKRDHTPRALLLFGGLLIAAACALLSPKAAVASQKPAGPVKTTSTQKVRILKGRSEEAGKIHSLSSTTLSQLCMLDVSGHLSNHFQMGHLM